VKTGRLANREEREQFETILKKVLTGTPVDFPSLIARKSQDRSPYTVFEGERIPTRISFDNNSSELCTVLEIQAEDRLGLLYAISTVLAELHLHISVAKICTEKGAAIDSFYVTDAIGQKIISPEFQAEIERRLKSAMSDVS